MLVQETIIRQDGVRLIKSYSDTNKYILQLETGYEYVEAIDPEDKHREYQETEKEIEPEPEV